MFLMPTVHLMFPPLLLFSFFFLFITKSSKFFRVRKWPGSQVEALWKPCGSLVEALQRKQSIAPDSLLFPNSLPNDQAISACSLQTLSFPARLVKVIEVLHSIPKGPLTARSLKLPANCSHGEGCLHGSHNPWQHFLYNMCYAMLCYMLYDTILY